MKPQVAHAAQRLGVNDRAGFETNVFAFKSRFSRRGHWNSIVETYRLYCLDGVGKVATAEWLEAKDDLAAIAAAEEMHGGRPCELWQGDRLVARMGDQRGS